MHFDLRTEFSLAAPRLAVYQTVRDTAAWPQWWRGCIAVDELEVEIVDLVPGETIYARAVGDVQGTGCWRFADGAGTTLIEYRWHVALHRPWMRAAAPLLAALFRVNHDHLMTAGAQGLARHLRVPLPQVRHSGHARAAAVA